MSDWQVAVIGAGPGGYAAAIRCAQLGMKTVCIDQFTDANDQPSLGGTCLNVGCIPSKALLEDSHFYHKIKQGHSAFDIPSVSVDLGRLQERKQAVVSRLCKGISQLLQGNGVHAITARAQLTRAGEILLDNGQSLSAKHIILATGSIPIEIPPAPFDHTRILDSTDALSLTAVPPRLAIIGAGAIGLELGSIWGRLGSEVTILEALPDFLPTLDRDIARIAQRPLQQEGLNIQLGCRVQAATVKKDQVEVCWEHETGTEKQLFDKVIVAVGRRAATDTLLAPDCGLELDNKGQIPVDDYCHTELDNIWAIGDIVRGPMLAHKATEEGVMVAERIAGEQTAVNYDLIPSVIYTHPEIATVGKSETQCKSESIDCHSSSFSFAANGRALAADESIGKVKLVGEKIQSGTAGIEGTRILGCQVVGPSAAEIVQQAAIAMEFGALAEDLALTTFSHPTISECLHEAALDLCGHPLHQLKKPKR